MLKSWMKVAIAAVLVVVAALVSIPLFVNADTFRPTVQSQLSSALGRSVSLGHLSLSLLSGSLVAEDIAIADDAAFSKSAFLDAKSLHIGVEMGALLFHRQVRITKLTIDSPNIHLISAENGTWNFSSIGKSASTTSPEKQSAFPDLTVGELKIEGGVATLSSQPAHGRPLSLSGIEVDIQQFSFLKSFPFTVSAEIPGSGSLRLEGNAGPISIKNAADTPFKATLQLKHFDAVAAGVVESSASLSGLLDVDAQLNSDGNVMTSIGKISASQLHLAKTGAPAPNPVNIDYTVAHDLDGRKGKVTDIALHTGSVAAHVSGSYRLTPDAAMLDLHMAAPNLPVDQVEQLLPAVGVVLPSGSALKGGTLTANLAITGPATAVTIAGPVSLDNTQLAGFDLGSKIEGLNPFGSRGAGTAIQTLRADVSSSPQQTELKNIFGNLPQIGSASGNGTVSPGGTLDFKLAAKFNPNTGVGAVATQAQNAIGNLLGGFAPLKSKVTAISNGGIPLTITGTTSSPVIRANLKAMLK